MKTKIVFALIIASLLSCEVKKEIKTTTRSPIVGTWRLIKGILIEKNDTVTTDYTQNVSFIKIINDTHFAFLQHDLEKGKGAAPVFVSGGGSYSLMDSLYTEHLEYCSDRAWEGNEFKFTVKISNDTLTQTGIEKIAEKGIDRLNIEKYVKLK
jgi:hypothetical protein